MIYLIYTVKIGKKHSNILFEYEQICKEISKKRQNQRFWDVYEEWKYFCEVKRRAPTASSKNEYEKHLCRKISSYIYRMKKDKEKYSKELEEYNKIFFKYRIQKSNIQMLEIWKEWCENNKRLPLQNAKDPHERSIRYQMDYHIRKMRMEPQKYSEQIKEYETIIKKMKNNKN